MSIDNDIIAAARKATEEDRQFLDGQSLNDRQKFVALMISSAIGQAFLSVSPLAITFCPDHEEGMVAIEAGYAMAVRTIQQATKEGRVAAQRRKEAGATWGTSA